MVTPVVKFMQRTPSDLAAISAVAALHPIIETSTGTERNLQTSIGLSEFGTDCMLCLAMALAEKNPVERTSNWKPFVGTLIHGHLEDVFKSRPRSAGPTDESPFYHTERKVYIDMYKGTRLGGSCDMFIQGESYGIVDDWKTQGPSVLRKSASGKVSPEYLTQIHAYGYGYELLGYDVTHVMIYALPRDGELNEAVPILMRYDRSIPKTRIELVHRMIDAAEMVGWDALIAQQTSLKGCYNCLQRGRADSQGWIGDFTGKS